MSKCYNIISIKPFKQVVLLVALLLVTAQLFLILQILESIVIIKLVI